MKNLKQYILIFVSFLIASGIILILEEVQPNWLHQLVWHANIFMLIVSIIAYQISMLGARYQDSYGTTILLAGLIARLFISLVFIAIVLFSEITREKLFIFNFFALYFWYTGFEIYALISNLRPQLKREEK